MQMSKKLIIVIGQVKPPSTDVTYLNANAYMVEKGKAQDLEDAIMDFRNKVEKDGFKITNALIFEPSIEPILSIGFLQLVWNRVQRPSKPVRCDGGTKP